MFLLEINFKDFYLKCFDSLNTQYKWYVIFKKQNQNIKFNKKYIIILIFFNSFSIYFFHNINFMFL